MTTNTAEAILTEAQEQRFIIEDFRPLAESLEWDLGQRYLRERGSKAFLSDTSPVPFVINNDGVLSRQAGELPIRANRLAVVRLHGRVPDIG